jgi:hypothetical protein
MQRNELPGSFQAALTIIARARRLTMLSAVVALMLHYVRRLGRWHSCGAAAKAWARSDARSVSMIWIMIIRTPPMLMAGVTLFPQVVLAR